MDKINTDINNRFFAVFDKLVEIGIFGTKITFYKDNNIDRRNLDAVRVSENRRVDSRILSIMVAKYNVSAHWLLTGEGKMFGKGK